LAAGKEELIIAIFEAYNRGEVDRSFELAHPDFVMDWSNSIGPIKGVYSGREELIGMWEAFTSAWSEISWEPQEILELSDTQAIVVNRLRMRGEGSGAPVEATGAQLWEFRDGRPLSVKLFQTKDEALAASGAEPG
jgi:ketosteroid isomerase-like protein